MNYWLFKSEPDAFSWDDLVRLGRSGWDGVRNFQAAANMKAMQVGDRGFFYHSNIGKEIVGVLEVIGPYRKDDTDPTGRFGLVDVKPVMPVKTPVTLKQVKADPALADMALVRLSRLSVSPVTPEAWAHICGLAGIPA